MPWQKFCDLTDPATALESPCGLRQLEGVRTLAGYAETSSHGRVRFVISLTSNDDEMCFRLLRAIESGL